tara:strand:- start:173 stop:430 length:258 start_codon:yes stop_codon:yes gene_type:complete
MTDINEQYKKSLEKLAEIMEPMAKHADHQALFRCPYKNKNDRCTAKFGCRNQRKQETGDLMLCASDDKLDYRPYWKVESESTKEL